MTESGFHKTITDKGYHSDPCPEPSLSASIAKVLVRRSPMHAAFNHPRLNPNYAEDREEPKRPQDIGIAAHKLMLGRGMKIDVIPFDSYRKDAAKEMRDDSRAVGNVPILQDDMASVKLMVEAARDQLVGTECEGIFDNGAPEVMMAWREKNGIWCRGLLDFLPDAAMAGGHITLADFKTTGASAHPGDWQKTAFDQDFDIQSVFYPRGLRALIPDVRSVAFKFVVIEQDAPYGLSIIDFGGQGISEAEELVELAIEAWGICLKKGEWPGYSKETTTLDPPVYRSMRSENRRLDLLARIAKWQRPHETKAAE